MRPLPEEHTGIKVCHNAHARPVVSTIIDEFVRD